MRLSCLEDKKILVEWMKFVCVNCSQNCVRYPSCFHGNEGKHTVQKFAETLCWWSWFASAPKDNSVISTLLFREITNMKGIYIVFVYGASATPKINPSGLEFSYQAYLEVRQASSFMFHVSILVMSESLSLESLKLLFPFFFPLNRITISFTLCWAKCYILSFHRKRVLKETEFRTDIFRGANVWIKQVKDRVTDKESK